MRALTKEETESIYGGQTTTLSSIFVTGHRPQPNPITYLPTPLPLPPTPVPSPPTALPMGSTPPCTAPANAVNANAIYGHELGPGGTLATTGYVPGTGSTGTASNPSATSQSGTVTRNNSGMTIGYGVDLGQMNGTDLYNYLTAFGTHGYYKGTIPYGVLSPYLGVRGPANVAAVVAAHGGIPPTINNDAASAISVGALMAISGRAANDYMTATSLAGLGAGANFWGLPAVVQTELTDVSYVFGSIKTLNPALPTGVMSAVGNQDWQTLASLLLNAPSSKWQSRLKADGQALQNAINSKSIPAKGTPCH